MRRFDFDRFARTHAADTPQRTPEPLSYRVNGTPGDDTLWGSSSADVINGGDGDDRLNDTAGGRDRMFGGAGNDVLIINEGGSRGRVTMDGGDGDDALLFTGASLNSANMTGGQGNDVLEAAGARYARIDAGAGKDHVAVTATFGTYVITLGAGADVVFYMGESGEIPGGVTFTDFQAGDGGDVLRTNMFLNGVLQGWTGDNPFAAGLVRFKQKDATAILQYRIDGAWDDLAAFLDTDAAAFTAHNLDGFGPNGAGEVGRTLLGTAGFDLLQDTVGSDRLDGRDGGDFIGSSFNGHDTLIGGRGDDTLSVERTEIVGPTRVSMDGGAGADHLEYRAFGAGDRGALTLKGGGGADEILAFGRAVMTIDAGADADDIWTNQVANRTITLGTGADHLHIAAGVDEGGAFYVAGVTEITDFATGDAGDVLDLDGYDYLLTGGTGWNDPFLNGYLRLVQSGSTTLLQMDRDGGGGGWFTWVRFADTDADDFTSHNFEGFEL